LLFYFFARFVFTTSFLFLQTCQRSSLGFPALLSCIFLPFFAVNPLSYLSISLLKILFSFSPPYLISSISRRFHSSFLLPKLARFNTLN
jgi:hypothetical protein